MPISWSDAVGDLDNADDLARYRRAVAQVRDLEPLVQSFIRAIRDSGKWPTVNASDYDPRQVPTGVKTRVGYTDRHVWCYIDRHWGLNTDTKRIRGIFLNVQADGRISFGSETEVSRVVSSADFYTLMDEMDVSKDWVPRELVGYLRALDLPIPE